MIEKAEHSWNAGCRACVFSRRFHINLTPTSPHFFKIHIIKEREAWKKGGRLMTFFGLEWYWWLVIVITLLIVIPFKIKFMKWWSERQQEKKSSQRGKWGDDE